ncbi:hypothetical protein F5X99DRAFT_338250 [Biscogniauxia marginata]|nr:hypothetical protein F5X99DRAFT_338250 [Biscogniauxia marginata]
MSDQRELLATPTGPHGTIRQRPLRSTSPSPSRLHRPRDDLLARLSPASIVDVLLSPTGPLKTCLEKASASEKAFAMKTANASKMIYDWLDELSDWPWPSAAGSAGFEPPPAKRRKLVEPKTPKDDTTRELPELAPQPDDTYFGSLPADDVTRYEKRIEQIQREMEDLDLEEIKNQVLHNHILPLSRPGTPFSDSGRSIGSIFSYVKMEDVTAVITAITVQALPNLSRLSRLLNIWSVRLLVLRKVPSLLHMFTDAEVALRSGWSAIASKNCDMASSNEGSDTVQDKTPCLSKKDFDVMKLVLQQKVTKPGRDLDFMLDALEGMMDTLPNEWLDRMEAIERDYAEWVTAADRRVQEGEWFKVAEQTRLSRSPVRPTTPQPKIEIRGPSPPRDSSDHRSTLSTPSDHRSDSSENAIGADIARRDFAVDELDDSSDQGAAIKILVDQPSKDVQGSTSQVIDLTEHAAHQHEVDSGAVVENPSLDYDGIANRRPTNHKATSFKQPRNQTYDGSDDVEVIYDEQNSPVLSELNRNIVRASPSESAKRDIFPLQPAFGDEFEPSILESVHEEDEQSDLPPTRLDTREDSEASFTSIIPRRRSSNSPDHSDDMFYGDESAEPELPRLPDPDEPFSSDAPSPPSSPPLRYNKPRSTSVTFKEVPEIATLPDSGNSTPPRSPLQPPIVFDPETSFEWESQHGSPSRMSTISNFSTNSDDDHLQRQISQLLESIPAQFRLQKPRVNLNPPDFQLPSRPKPRNPDSTRRSGSALSSRGGTPSYSRSTTPSFMLAPAREPRPRSRSSQGIRLYHLSRSTGEPPIKLFIRCVGENGERVMVRVGGGWADLGEYLRDYATHHSRRSKGESKVEVTDAPPPGGRLSSSPCSRPGSSADRPVTPLTVRKTRKEPSEDGGVKLPKTPHSGNAQESDPPSSGTSGRSRASSAHFDWENDEDSSLGLAGPKAKRAELSDEGRAWVQSMKEKVRIASSERMAPPSEQNIDSRFGEINKVGGTKRVYRKN